MSVLHEKTVKCLFRVLLWREQAFDDCLAVCTMPESLQVFENLWVNIVAKVDWARHGHGEKRFVDLVVCACSATRGVFFEKWMIQNVRHCDSLVWVDAQHS